MRHAGYTPPGYMGGWACRLYTTRVYGGMGGMLAIHHPGIWWVGGHAGYTPPGYMGYEGMLAIHPTGICRRVYHPGMYTPLYTLGIPPSYPAHRWSTVYRRGGPVAQREGPGLWVENS